MNARRKAHPIFNNVHRVAQWSVRSPWALNTFRSRRFRPPKNSIGGVFLRSYIAGGDVWYLNTLRARGPGFHFVRSAVPVSADYISYADIYSRPRRYRDEDGGALPKYRAVGIVNDDISQQVRAFRILKSKESNGMTQQQAKDGQRHISASGIFQHYLASNVQVGVADVFEIQSLMAGMDLVTSFVQAQVGLADGFTFKKLADLIEERHKEFRVQIHESRSKENSDAYLYIYERENADSLVGILLVNTTTDKTRCTTIALKSFAERLNVAINDLIKDDHHAVFLLTKTDQGISEARHSIRKATAAIGHDAFYPFIEEGLVSYFTRFLAAKSGILLLVGPPGTGKSTWLRSLILHSAMSAALAYDKDTIRDMGMLQHFYSSNHCILALEDADAFIGKREHGNEDLQNVLNFADGVTDNPGKKMVISTNLGSLAKVDQALIRKGRCFDIVVFRELTPEEANAARAAIGLAPREFSEPVVLADALSDEGSKLSEERETVVGFV